MAGFFKKVAGAFVELEDGGGKAEATSGESSSSLDEITRETSALLAQLEGQAEPGAPPVPAPVASGMPVAGMPVRGPSVPASSSSASALQMNADQVFQAAQLVDGPNSSERILKLIGGLAMFPPEQQVVMLRAMDSADDGWSEPEVLEDARARQSVLRRHLQAVEDERDGRMKRLEEEINATQAEGTSIAEEIDRKIADLQQKRQMALVDTTKAVGDLQQKQSELEAEAENARRGITHVINALSQLITFFTGGKTSQTPPQQ